MSFLSSISMFPETRFMRIGGRSEIKNNAGGVATILLLIIVFAILVYKLDEVFKYKTVFITQNKFISRSVAGNITTNQNAKFFVAGIGHTTFNFDVTAQVSNTNSGTTTAITLVSCSYLNTQFANFMCLPPDQTYNMGGTAGGIIEFTATCKAGQTCSKLDVINFGYTPNPSSTTEPWVPDMNWDGFLVPTTGSLDIFYKLQKNTIEENKNVWPFTSNNVTNTAFDVPYAAVQEPQPSFTPTRMLVAYNLHNQSRRYTVKYYTVIDALAYLGGIFTSLFGIFFFLAIYGLSFFDFYVAKHYFRSKMASEYGFGSWIKQSLYGVLCSCCIKPENWELQEKRKKMQQTVNRVSDWVLVLRRLDFQDRALRILLNEHQIKGLHLAKDINVSEADRQLDDFEFKSQLLRYLKDKNQLQLANDHAMKSGQNLKESYELNFITNDSHQEMNQDEKDQDLIEIEGHEEGQELSSQDIAKIEKKVDEDIAELFREAYELNDQKSKKIVQGLDKNILAWLKRRKGMGQKVKNKVS